MTIRRSSLLFAGLAVGYLILFVLVGYSDDGDNIAGRPFDGSVHVLIFGEIARLGLGRVLPFVYALVFAYLLGGHIRRREWERVLFFASPMVLVNATDVFNRFMFCLVCAQLMDWGLRRRKLIVAALAALSLATTHPFSAAFVLCAAAPLMSLPFVLLIAAGAQREQFDALLGPLFAGKRSLLHTLGPDLPFLSQGNYAIDPTLRSVAFGLIWWLAVLLPGIGTKVNPVIAIGLAGFQALWIAAIIYLSPQRRNIVLVMAPMSVLVALFVGNSADGYRHLLPVFYAGLMLFSRSPPREGRGFAFGLIRLTAGEGRDLRARP
jgi:hypothetical protein